MKLIKEQEREGLGEKLVFSIHKQASSSIQALSEWSVDNKARKKGKKSGGGPVERTGASDQWQGGVKTRFPPWVRVSFYAGHQGTVLYPPSSSSSL